MSFEMNTEIASLHGHLCGDGCLYLKWEKRSPANSEHHKRRDRFPRYVIDYSNTEDSLLEKVARTLKKLCPTSYLSIGKTFVRLRHKHLFLHMKDLGCGKSAEWEIPREILDNTTLRRAWLQSFFDDDGSVQGRTIAAYTTNESGCDQIIKMLDKERIKTSVWTRAPRKNHHLPLHRVRIRNESWKNFSKIGFSHAKKKQRFEKLLKNKL